MAKNKSKSGKPGSAKKVSSKAAAAKKTPVKKGAVAKARKATTLPGGGRRNAEKERLLLKIAELAEILGNDSLGKLLNDAAILVHNEAVLKEFRAGKGNAGPVTPGLLAGIEEGRDGTYYMINLKGHRSIFGIEEMKNLVRACHGAKSEAEAGPRLYGWLERERRDVLKNSKIADNTDGSLPTLWKMVVSAYSVGE